MFGRKKSAAVPAAPAVDAPAADEGAAQALRRAIDERRATEPLIGATIAGKEVFSRVMSGMTTDRGVHIESIVTALGALAGKASQVAALHGRSSGDPAYANLSLMVATSADGREYYFGDALNRPLLESQYSVWGLVAGAAQTAGATLPDLAELVTHAAQSVDTEDFGRPRYEPDTEADDTPQGYLVMWDALNGVVAGLEPDPQYWPVAYGIAVQELFALASGQFDLGVLTRIVMDSAIATSKIPVAR
jgi:hypothetical protein